MAKNTSANLSIPAYTRHANVIDETIKNGMIPVMNLHHFDIPVELYKKSVK